MLTSTDQRCPKGEDTTDLLQQWGSGDREAGELVMSRLYPDLRRLAASLLRGRDSTLHPSDLLHDVYLKVAGQRNGAWQNRTHFLALAARFGRRVLVDHHRKRSRQARIEELEAGTREESSGEGALPLLDPLLLEQALEELAAVDPIAERIVELRFFGGLTVNETAAALGMARATTTRRWRFARAWLMRKLEAWPGTGTRS